MSPNFLLVLESKKLNFIQILSKTIAFKSQCATIELYKITISPCIVKYVNYKKPCQHLLVELRTPHGCLFFGQSPPHWPLYSLSMSLFSQYLPQKKLFLTCQQIHQFLIHSTYICNSYHNKHISLIIFSHTITYHYTKIALR